MAEQNEELGQKESYRFPKQPMKFYLLTAFSLQVHKFMLRL